MKNLSVKAQLSLDFGLLVTVVVVVCLLALYGLGAANDRFSNYLNGSAALECSAIEVRALADRRGLGVRAMALATTDADRASAKANAVQANDELHAKLKSLKDTVSRGTSVGFVLNRNRSQWTLAPTVWSLS